MNNKVNNNVNINIKPNWLDIKIGDLYFSRGYIRFKNEKISWQKARKFKSENVKIWRTEYCYMSSIREYYLVYNNHYGPNKNKYVREGMSVSEVCPKTDIPDYIIAYEYWSGRFPDQYEQISEEITVYKID